MDGGGGEGGSRGLQMHALYVLQLAVLVVSELKYRDESMPMDK